MSLSGVDDLDHCRGTELKGNSSRELEFIQRTDRNIMKKSDCKKRNRMKDDIVNESVWCFYVCHRGGDTVRCSKMKLCALSKKERHREVCLHVSSRKFT